MARSDQSSKRVLLVSRAAFSLEEVPNLLKTLAGKWEVCSLVTNDPCVHLAEMEGVDIVIASEDVGEDLAFFFQKICKAFPRVIRIVVLDSGEERAGLVLAVKADRFVPKPIETGVLEATLSEVLEAQGIENREAASDLLRDFDPLPMLPRLYLQLKEKLHAQNGSFEEIAGIISQDVTTSAKILQLVNSAFFGLRKRIDTIHRAVVFLGLETIKAVILTAGVFNRFTREELSRFPVEAIYHHSLFVGTLAGKLARTVSKDRTIIEQSIIGGMLHDVGKLIFIRTRPDRWKRVAENARKQMKPLSLLERQEFGINHTDLGAYLLGLWGLPDAIVKTVACHHAPQRCTLVFNPAVAVYAANALFHTVGKINGEGDDEGMGLDVAYLETLGLRDVLPQWKNYLRESLRQLPKSSDFQLAPEMPSG